MDNINYIGVGHKVNYIDLLEANSLIQKRDIKGKKYGEVSERIKAFRYVYPQGTIRTELLSNDGESEKRFCVFKAEVYSDEGTLLGTGTAQEQEGSSFINNTSYIENCETSAVGRALSMAGFAIGTTIMSYEELSNAELQQELMETITDVKLQTLQGLIKQCQQRKIAYEKILENYKVKELKDLTNKQYGELLLSFKDIMKEDKKDEK